MAFPFQRNWQEREWKSKFDLMIFAFNPGPIIRCIGILLLAVIQYMYSHPLQPDSAKSSNCLTSDNSKTGTDIIGSKVSVSYWNDNMFLQEFISDLIKPGIDDDLTAGWMFQYGSWNNAEITNIDLYYALITNKGENYRTDLLSLNYQSGRWSGYNYYIFGLGLTGQGNFGGSAIQTGYHNVTRISEINIPYCGGNNYGISISGHGQYAVWQGGGSTVSFNSSSMVSLGAGTSCLKAGLSLVQPVKINWKKISSYFKIYGLGSGYFNSQRLLAPVFQDGISVGGLYSIRVFRQSELTLWMNYNQYGRQSPYYGFKYSWRQGHDRPDSFLSNIYP